MVVHWWTDLDASFKFSLLLKSCLIIWGTTCGTFTGDHSWGKASEKMYACKIIQDCQCFDSAPNQARANFLNVQQLYLQTMIQVQQFLQTMISFIMTPGSTLCAGQKPWVPLQLRLQLLIKFEWRTSFLFGKFVRLHSHSRVSRFSCKSKQWWETKTMFIDVLFPFFVVHWILK